MITVHSIKNGIIVHILGLLINIKDGISNRIEHIKIIDIYKNNKKINIIKNNNILINFNIIPPIFISLLYHIFYNKSSGFVKNMYKRGILPLYNIP